MSFQYREAHVVFSVLTTLLAKVAAGRSVSNPESYKTSVVYPFVAVSSNT